MNDEQRHLALIAALADREIKVMLPAMGAFTAVSALQLALRHPAFPATVLPHVVQVAQIIICTLDPEPDGELGRLLMMGWDPANDIKLRYCGFCKEFHSEWKEGTDGDN
jgi:hypothetical protein